MAGSRNEAGAPPARAPTQASDRMGAWILVIIGALIGSYGSARLSRDAAWWWPAPALITVMALLAAIALFTLSAGVRSLLGVDPLPPGGQIALLLGILLGAMLSGAVCTVIALIASVRRTRASRKNRAH